MENRICIYHSCDLDGWVSAAIVKGIHPDVVLVGYSYGDPIPVIPPDQHVIICDCAFDMEIMDEIATNAASFTWIDHHASAIKKFREYWRERPDEKMFWNLELPEGDQLIGACELTWKYYHPEQNIPWAVELLGMYDCFRHKQPENAYYEYYALWFTLAALTIADSPDTAEIFLTMNGHEIREYMKKGNVIYDYKVMEAQQLYKKGIAVVINEKRFILFNADHFNPPSYGIDYHKDGFDGSGYFRFDGKMWHFSLTNDDGSIDCSEICKAFGGGGHKGAAGFEPDFNTLACILNGDYASDRYFNGKFLSK